MSEPEICAWIDDVQRETETERSQSVPATMGPKKRKLDKDISTTQASHASSTGTTRLSAGSATGVADLWFAGITQVTADLKQLPADAHLLFSFVHRNYTNKSVPAAVLASVSASTPLRLSDQNIIYDYHLPDDAAHGELGQLRDILDEAHRCASGPVGEPDWNSAVHHPLLRLAFKQFPSQASIVAWNTTTATICSEYIDEITTVKSHKVDFCLTVEPVEAMRGCFGRLDPPTFNHTMYEPLRNRPIAVSIETKSLNPTNTGIPQLAVWTHAWINRITKLDPDTSIPTLPLIRVVGHNWFVLWAWREKGNSTGMTITSEMPVGDTYSLMGVYSILAFLRELSKWADGVFRPWVLDTFK